MSSNSTSPSPATATDICTVIEGLLKVDRQPTITLRVIVDRLKERGFGILMVLLALPNCLPIPLPPGTSTVFSIPLLFVSFQMVWGREEIWMPKSLMEKRISTSHLEKAIAVVLPYLQKLHKFIKPRLSFAASKAGECVIGAFWLLFAATIAIPVPMTNFLPGVGILVSALGLLNRDGYVIIAGLLIGLAGIAFSLSLLFLGKAVVGSLFF